MMFFLTTTALLSWMWRSTVYLGACWLLYWLALRRETGFHYNRQFLRYTPWLALLLPPLLTVLAPNLGSWLPSQAAPSALLAPAFVLPTAVVSATGTSTTYWEWLPLVYVAGVGLGVARLGWQIFRLWQTTRRLPRQQRVGYTLVETGGRLPVSSFGRLVFWDETAGLTPAEAQQVLYHELVHVQQRHTWEQLQLLALQAVLWFNPFVHCYPRALALTHEYLADAAVVRAAPTTAPRGSYPALLARLALRRLYSSVPLTHCFTRSPILTRIAMLQSTSPVRRWKQWLLLPVSAVLFVAFSCEQTAVLEKPAVADATERQTAPPPPRAIDPQVDVPPPTPRVRNLLYTKVYQYVDHMPRYQGGVDHLLTDVTKQMHYPAAAKAAKLQGKVFIAFVVSAEGRVQDVELKKGITAPAGLEAVARQMDEAALAAVRALPGKWTPGEQSGNSVPVAFTIPVSFAL